MPCVFPVALKTSSAAPYSSRPERGLTWIVRSDSFRHQMHLQPIYSLSRSGRAVLTIYPCLHDPQHLRAILEPVP